MSLRSKDLCINKSCLNPDCKNYVEVKTKENFLFFLSVEDTENLDFEHMFPNIKYVFGGMDLLDIFDESYDWIKIDVIKRRVAHYGESIEKFDIYKGRCFEEAPELFKEGFVKHMILDYINIGL